MHTGAVQALPTQVEAALAYFVVQSVPIAPQPPQFLGAVAMLTSQPVLGSPSQSRKVPLQLPISHEPPMHFGVPLVIVQP